MADSQTSVNGRAAAGAFLINSELRQMLADWLDAGMAAKGWSQVKLAEVSGVSRDTINRIATKKTTSNPLSLQKLATALETPLPSLSDSMGRRDAHGQTGSTGRHPEASRDVPFVIGVRAMLETMRRQIEALEELLGPNHDGLHEMLESMGRQVNALEKLLLGTTARAGGVPMNELVADMEAVAELGDRAAGWSPDRRHGADRRQTG